MSLILHHVRKDLRHSRWLIAATWLVAAGILWLPASPVEQRAELMQWLPLFRYGSWVLLYLTVGRIVQLDAPLRDTAFHRSRPVSGNMWLVSKLATCVIIIVPIALLHALMLPLAGLWPGFIDLLLIFAEEMLTLGVVTVAAMSLAARSQTYARFLTVTMGIGFGAIISFMVYANIWRWFDRGAKPEWSYDIEYLKLSRLLITQVVAVIGLLAGLFLTFRVRRPERLSAAICGTTLAAALSWFFWPVNFVKTLTRPEAEAPRSEWPDFSAVGFLFEERRIAPKEIRKFSLGLGSHNDVYYQSVRAFTRMDGLAPGWFAYPNGYRSSLRSPNGMVFHSLYTAWAGLAAEMVLPSVGIPSPWQIVNGATQVDIGEFPLAAIESAGPGASLEGEVRIPIKRPVILARIPLVPGSSARIGSRRLTVTRVEIGDRDRISYQVIEERAMSRLRGGWSGEPHRRIDMIVIHSERKEFLTNGGHGTSNLSTANYTVSRNDFKQLVWRDSTISNHDRSIPPDWLDGAELIITGDEYGGTFTRGFRFENVNLIDKSWQP